MNIYLDYMATTPIDPRVIHAMLAYMGPQAAFGNAASITHGYGLAAANALDKARAQVAATVGADPAESIIFTSGATEANNLAILGAARFYQAKGRHLITMQTEHTSVLASFRQLEREGFTVTYLAPEPNGLLNLATLKAAISSSTILASIMHVNNEIGVIQDIAAIGAVLRAQGVLYHCDAAQSAGKLALNLQSLPIDLMSFSAHKIYGPKGVGALYCRQKPRLRLQPQSFGSINERGLRAGTLPIHQIVGMGEAFAIAAVEREFEQRQCLSLRQRVVSALSALPGIHFNGDLNQRIAGNINFSCDHIPGNALLLALHQLALSATSACMAASHQPSYVLKALGLDDEQAYGSIRLSVGRFTTDDEIDQAIELLTTQIQRWGV